MKHKRGKNETPSADISVAELKLLREKALKAADPEEKWVRTNAVLNCKSCPIPAVLLAAAAKLAFVQGLELLLAMEFASEDIKQPYAKADNTPCWETFWQCAYDSALKGAQKHKSAVCAAICAELTYIRTGGASEESYNVLEQFLWRATTWRDPAEDILDLMDADLTACEKPKGTSKKERVEEKMSIVRGVTERSKKMALAWKAGEGPRQGPLGALMRMDLRCHLLVPRLLGKLQAVQTTARRVHMILSDVDVQSLREMKAAQDKVKEKKLHVIREHGAIMKAAKARPGLYRSSLPLALYELVQELFDTLQEDAEEQQRPESQPVPMVFYASRGADPPPKLSAGQQKAVDLQAKEVKQFLSETYAELNTPEEKLAKQESLHEVPVAAVTQAIKEDKKSNKEEAAHAQELLASWCQRGKPQAVADISAGSLACLERPFLQEYAESLAAPLLLQLQRKDLKVEAGPGNIAAGLSHDDLIKVAVEGQGLVWEGDLPGEARVPSRAELNLALERLGTAGPAQPAASPAAAPDAPSDAQPRLHPMAPVLGGCESLAQPLYERLQCVEKEASRSVACLDVKEFLKTAAGPLDKTLMDLDDPLTHLPEQVNDQEVLAELAAKDARGSYGPDSEWAVKAVARQNGGYPEIVKYKAELKIGASEFEGEALDLEDDGPLDRELMRARGRLLLLGRYHLWRLEAYHCEACWESSPEAVKAAVDAAKAEVDQRCASLRTDVITFANVLRFDDDNFLEHTKGFVFASGPKDGHGEAKAAELDLPWASRYRFYAAADGPGRACGPAHMTKFVGLNCPVGAAAKADPAADKDAAEDWTAAQSKTPTLEKGAQAGERAPEPRDCQSCAATSTACEEAPISTAEGETISGHGARTWLGEGPSPSEYPDPDEYDMRDPDTTEEILQDIFDGLEMLRESRLLSPWLVTYLAAHTIRFAKEEGVNWLQLHWEHMAFLPVNKLAALRDKVLEVLVLNCDALKATTDALALQRDNESNGTFTMAEGKKDCIQFIGAPLRGEVIDAINILQQKNPCDCDKSKQRRAAEKEGEQAAEENVGNGHVVVEAPSADGQESDPSLKHISAGDWELAKEYMDCQCHNAPEQVSALMVDLLFGTTGHTNELRLPTTYCLKEGAAETLRALLLRATACLCLVMQQSEKRNEALQIVARLFRIHLDYVEPIKDGSLSCGNLSPEDIRRVDSWLDQFKHAQLHLKQLQWLEELERDRLRVTCLKVPERLLHDHFGRLLRRKHAAAKDKEQVQKLDKQIKEASVERYGNDPDASLKSSGLQNDLERHQSGSLRLSAEKVLQCLSQEQELLRDCFRGALTYLFRCDIRIANARLAALRLLRTCELELTVPFVERLEKWLVQGLRITLQKAARERFERLQEAKMAALVEAEEKQKAVQAKKQAKKAAAKAKTVAPALPLPPPQAAEEAHPNGHAAEGALSHSQQGPAVSWSDAGDVSESASAERPIDHAPPDKSDNWAQVPSFSAERAQAGNEQEEAPEPASTAETLLEAAIVPVEAGGFEYVQSKGKKKKKKKTKAAEGVDPEETSAASASVRWWTDGAAGEDDVAEEWQTAKPRRQQPKRGDWGDPASPPPGQEHQLNGHSVEPLPPPPSPPPPAVAAGEQRAAAAAHRPQSEKLCLKCDDPTHKAVECPELAHLPPFLRSEVTMALLEGNMQRAQVLLTRVPVETCHMCDVPGHNLYNCPQLDSMPRHMRADLANAFRTANVKWRQKILAEWKHLDAARSWPGAAGELPPAAASNLPPSTRSQPGAPPQVGRGQPPPPPPPERATSRADADSWRRQGSTGSDPSLTNGGFPAAEHASGRPQPRGAAADVSGSRPRPRGASGESAEARPSPRTSMRATASSFMPQNHGQPSTPREGITADAPLPHVNHVQDVRAVSIPANSSYRPLQQGQGTGSPALDVLLPVPHQGQREDRADDDFSSILDMLCPQASPEAPPAGRSWAGVAELQPAGAWGALVPSPSGELVSASSLTQAQRSQQSPSRELVVATPGLQNQIGEYNCFLNVIIQSLWNCRHFRAPFKAASAAFCSAQSNAVVAALAELFATFEAQEQQGSRNIVAPTRLREALDALNSHAFQIGEMSDAAEVLGALYDSLGDVPGGAELVNLVFGLHVRELVHCGSCGCDTHCTRYTQFFYNVSATALRLQGMLNGEDGRLPPLGRLLWKIEAQDMKSCDTDVGGCGQLNSIQHLLEGAPPNVFTVQLAWESQRESSDNIRATLSAIQEEVDVGHIYKAQESRLYRLRSMVCYYGAHYHAFVHTGGQWIMFDDANTSAVGSWEAVMHKCQLGKIQPSVLFYEALGT